MKDRNIISLNLPTICIIEVIAAWLCGKMNANIGIVVALVSMLNIIFYLVLSFSLKKTNEKNGDICKDI